MKSNLTIPPNLIKQKEISETHVDVVNLKLKTRDEYPKKYRRKLMKFIYIGESMKDMQYDPSKDLD